MPFRHVISRGVNVSAGAPAARRARRPAGEPAPRRFLLGRLLAVERAVPPRRRAAIPRTSWTRRRARCMRRSRRPATSRPRRSPRRTSPASSWTCKAGFGLPEGLDPDRISVPGSCRATSGLWTELTREEVFAAQEQYRVDSRIKRLNELGFDVEELDIQTIEGGHKIRLRVQVVEPGHHRRRLEALTGLDVQENQARRLLNDLDHFRAWQGGLEGRAIPEREAAQRWLEEVVPADARLPSRPSRPPSSTRPRSSTSCSSIAGTRRSVPAATCRLLEVVPSYVEEVLARLPAPEVSSLIGSRPLSCRPLRRRVEPANAGDEAVRR
ncbi:MAG: DUF4032 domain-containing protein [Rhodopseudomonas palustris]|nr:DUF4032 domain-containing protein [Rhodopseudomonas palustris]